MITTKAANHNKTATNHSQHNEQMQTVGLQLITTGGGDGALRRAHRHPATKQETAETWRRRPTHRKQPQPRTTRGRASCPARNKPGARGGAGTTSLLANVGWTLANKEGRRVVLVDLDLQNGSLHLAMDFPANHGLREALENAHRLAPPFLDRKGGA